MTHKMLIALASIWFAGMTFGCATQPQMYYWGDYSDTLYDVKKEPGAETIARHKEVLENIVVESENRNLRIPPGVCAELGYIYALQNDTTTAISFFEREKQIYPESTIFMDRLIQQSEKRASENSTKNESLNEYIDRENKIGGGTK